MTKHLHPDQLANSKPKKRDRKFIFQIRKIKWTSGVIKESGGNFGMKSNIFATWTRKFY